MQFPIVIFGAISAVTLGGAGLFLLDKPKQDLGGSAPTSIQAASSGPKHDILGPVGAREATGAPTRPEKRPPPRPRAGRPLSRSP